MVPLPDPQGDDLTTIAARFNVPVADIRAINRLKKTRLAAGRYLLLPQSSSTTALAAIPAYIPPVNIYEEENFDDAVFYCIKRGDNISRIARRFHVSWAQLCQWNHMTRSTLLRPGRMLLVRPTASLDAVAASGTVPADTAGPDLYPARTYVVRSGDTPFSIAKRSGITLAHLLAWNGLDAQGPIVHAGPTR